MYRFIYLVLGAFMAMVMAISLPAQAHSRAELQEWEADWQERFDEAIEVGIQTTGGVSLALIEPLVTERMDWVDRHPCYFLDDCPEPEAVHSPSTSSSVSVPGGVEGWRGLVAAYFPADQVDRALCIMYHESKGNPNANNPRSSAAGLFQFLKSTWDNMVPSSVTGGSYSSGQVYNAEANIRAAAWLQRNVGWSQWSPYKRGLCR